MERIYDFASGTRKALLKTTHEVTALHLFAAIDIEPAKSIRGSRPRGMAFRLAKGVKGGTR
jgi:hypothetical protein